MSRTPCTLLLCLLSLLMLHATTARAEDYFPLDPGRSWTYMVDSPPDSSITEIHSVDGFDTFMGREVVRIKVVQEITPQITYSAYEYFSKDQEGCVYLHGTRDAESEGSYAVCDPPMMMLDSDLSQGHSWSQTISVEFYEFGMPLFGQDLEMDYSVVGTFPVEIPAGSFDALQIHATATELLSKKALPQSAAGWALLRALTRDVMTTDQWYAAGVGLLGSYTPSEDMEVVLIDYDRGVATRSISWGGLKAAY